MLETFGLRLSHLITVRGLTQQEFAKGLQASPAFISDMIRGIKKPGADFLCRISTQYHVSLDWLLMGRGTMEGASSIIDIEWFRMVMLRIELARLAASGNTEATLLAEELLGKKSTDNSVPVERQKLLDHLSAANDESTLIASLYNNCFHHNDPAIRAREALAAAMLHFQSAHIDPLAALVAGRDTAKNHIANPLLKPQIKQKISGKNNRVAGKNYIEKSKDK